MNAKPVQGPGGLTVHELGLAAADLKLQEGAFFWEEVNRFTAEAQVTSLVEELLAEDDAPRVWVILDEPERTATRAAAVLSVARALSRRQLKVIVLDGDDRHPDLSRWTGRSDNEGWLDFARYGASLSLSSTPLPWDGDSGRLLGVGSYCPTWLTAEEANRLVSRLRSHADVVLVSAPTGEDGAVWASVPSIRLVCWDRVAGEATKVGDTVRELGLLGDRPRALLAFGGGRPKRSAAPVAAEAPQATSPIFKRIAIGAAAVVVVLAVWWFGVMNRRPAPTYDDTLAQRPVAADHSPTVTPDAAVPDTIAPDSAAAVAADTVAVAAGQATPPPPTPEPAAEADPWGGRVGVQGWALHVYSIADSAAAALQLTDMEALGVAGAVRDWTDANGRRWYRIYAGSFPTRASAREAAPELQDILGTDWSAPARFR